MPSQGDNNASGFVAAMEAANSTNPEKGREIPTDGFPFMPRAGHRLQDDEKEPSRHPPGTNPQTGNLDLLVSVKRKVFLIFRPWADCARCGEEISAGALNLPVVGDITCSHTQLDEYEDVMNKCMDGTYVLKAETEHVQKDGTVLVSVQWLVPKVQGGAKQKRRVGPLAGS